MIKTPKRLITHGCSFTFGEELENPAKQCWPAHLAARLEVPTLLNLARPAYSNDHVMQDLLKLDLKMDHDLVIIGLTSFTRLLFFNDDGWFTTIPNIHSGSYDKFINCFFKEINVEWLFERYLTHIVYMQEYLKARHVKFMFFNAIDNINNHKTPLSKYQTLTDKINTDKFYGWPFASFQTIIGNNPTMLRGHPTESQHKQLAEMFELKLKLLYEYH